jgi:hypothetical protein
MLRVQQRLREFEPSAALTVRHFIPARKHPEKIRLHGLTGRVHVAAHVQRIGCLRSLAFIHAVHRARKCDAALNVAIFIHQSREPAACRSLVRKQILHEQPVEHGAITRLRATIAPALHRG